MPPSAKSIIIEELQSVLPKASDPFILFYWRTKPKRVRPLVFRGGYKSTEDNKTDPSSTDLHTTHFIVVSFKRVITYAIELDLYNAPDVQTLFVSKADTTGHYTLDSGKRIVARPKLSLGQVTSAILRGISRCFLDPRKPVKLCLFARAADQYLFPFSNEISQKHVMSGTVLLKWWIKVLEGLMQSPVIDVVQRARLQIPGSSASVIKSYFKFSRDATNDSHNPWQVGDVFWPDGEDKAAVYCVPRFEDDPLTRFLDSLVDERRAKSTTQKLFWLELQGRQEFRLSIEVGILGIEYTLNPKLSVYRELIEANDTSIEPLSSRDFKLLKEFIISQDYSLVTVNTDTYDAIVRRKPFIEIRGTREDLSLERKLDKNSGKLEGCVNDLGTHITKSLDTEVNTIDTSLIKKRKKNSNVENNSLDSSTVKKETTLGAEQKNIINSLDSSLVRKKVGEERSSTTTTTTEVVNVLGSSLIRKKRKPT